MMACGVRGAVRVRLLSDTNAIVKDLTTDPYTVALLGIGEDATVWRRIRVMAPHVAGEFTVHRVKGAAVKELSVICKHERVIPLMEAVEELRELLELRSWRLQVQLGELDEPEPPAEPAMEWASWLYQCEAADVTTEFDPRLWHANVSRERGTLVRALIPRDPFLIEEG